MGRATSTTGQVGSGQSIVTVSVQHFGQTYNFQVNTRTCGIINGADIVVQEINRFNSAIGQVYVDFSTFRNRDAYINYFQVNSGQLEQLRHSVESSIASQTGCGSTYYLVGGLAMDTSGLGNIMFGYAMGRLPYAAEATLANYFQSRNAESIGWPFDLPDDRSQRNLGRLISQAIANGQSLTSTLVTQLAEEVGLF